MYSGTNQIMTCSDSYCDANEQVTVFDDDKWVYGDYSCLAKNVIGTANDSMQLLTAGSQ